MSKIYDMLTVKFGYKKQMICKIVYEMEGKSKTPKRETVKTPVSQSLYRDISIFIDFMKWTGTRQEFYDFAKIKYGLARRTTINILQLNYMADPKRYEITKLY